MENKKWLQTYLYICVGQFLSMLSSYAVQFAIIIIWLSLEYQSAQVLAYAMYLLMGLTFIVSGLLTAQQFLWFVAVTGIGGISMAIFAACFNTILQIEVAPEKLGRVFSLYYSLAILPSTIGLLFAGLIAEKIGITNTFIISESLVIIMGLLCHPGTHAPGAAPRPCVMPIPQSAQPQ